MERAEIVAADIEGAVLVEKPFAMNAAEAAEIVEVARELLEAGFGALGVELADRMKRPRLEYQVAIYHRSAPSTADCQPTVEVTDAVC